MTPLTLIKARKARAVSHKIAKGIFTDPATARACSTYLPELSRYVSENQGAESLSITPTKLMMLIMLAEYAQYDILVRILEESLLSKGDPSVPE